MEPHLNDIYFPGCL